MSFCVKKLKKSYNKKVVLNDFDFKVETGKSVGLLGPNGAGKTTFIRCSTGLSKITGGEITFNGLDIKTNFVEYISNISVIFDKSHFYEDLSGRDNLKIVCNLKSCDVALIDKVSIEVGLEKRLDDRVRNYSYGMKKRLQVAASLLGSPKLIFLDETFSGLDINATTSFINMFVKIRKDNVSLVISTHNISVLDKLVDQVYIINNGRVVGFIEEDNIHDKVIEITCTQKELLKLIEHSKIQVELVKEEIDKIFLKVKDSVTMDLMHFIMNTNLKINNVKTLKYLEFYYSELLGEYSNDQIN